MACNLDYYCIELASLTCVRLIYVASRNINSIYVFNGALLNKLRAIFKHMQTLAKRTWTNIYRNFAQIDVHNQSLYIDNVP